MRNYRCSWELILNILNISQTKIGVSNILYQTRLSHPILSKHLKHLISLGLIEETIADRSKTYFITEKGDKILSHLKAVKKVLL